jgi:hypothetical protein
LHWVDNLLKGLASKVTLPDLISDKSALPNGIYTNPVMP